MSGIEVAGLALGAFPVLLSGLEKWGKSAEIWDDWWQIKGEFGKCKRELSCAEIELEGSLKHFLLPLVMDDHKIDELISEPGGSQWSEPQLEEKLRKRLPRSYRLFLETVQDIQKVVESIKREVGVEHADFVNLVIDPPNPGNAVGSSLQLGPPTDGLSHSTASLRKWLNRSNGSAENAELRIGGAKSIRKSLKAQTQRARFAFRRTERKKLFEELSWYNQRLQTLLKTDEKTVQLEQARDNLHATSAPEGVLSLWRHAERLYDLLARAFRCRCRHLHQLHLQLYHQTKCVNAEFYFRLLYGLVESECPWHCRTLTVRKVDSAAIQDSGPDVDPQAFGKKVSAAPTNRADKAPIPKASSAKSNLTLGKQVTRTRQGVSFVVPSTTSSETSAWEDLRVPPIYDLCAAVASNVSPEGYFGKLQDTNGTFLLLSPTESISSGLDSVKTTSLAELLRKGSITRLTRQQRYQIALTLASSHVQLSSTPWLSTWEKSQVLVTTSRTPEMYIQHPIAKITNRAAATSPALSTYAPTNACAASLQALGILLLELCHGVALEEHETRQALQVPGATPDIEAALDLTAAQRWAPSVEDEAGPRFANAVHWCLGGGLAGHLVSEPRNWRMKMWENVVQPLQWSLEQFY